MNAQPLSDAEADQLLTPFQGIPRTRFEALGLTPEIDGTLAHTASTRTLDRVRVSTESWDAVLAQINPNSRETLRRAMARRMLERL